MLKPHRVRGLGKGAPCLVARRPTTPLAWASPKADDEFQFWQGLCKSYKTGPEAQGQQELFKMAKPKVGLDQQNQGMPPLAAAEARVKKEYKGSAAAVEAVQTLNEKLEAALKALTEVEARQATAGTTSQYKWSRSLEPRFRSLLGGG